MKKIYIKLSIVSILLALPFSMFGQEMNEKLSGTTRLLMNERDGILTLSDNTSQRRLANISGRQTTDVKTFTSTLRRPIAPIITRRDGTRMVDAFIYLRDVNDTDALKAQGVEVQCTFRDFVTACIPVDKIEKLAEIDNVTCIDVAEMEYAECDISREKMNVDDVLTLSSDAQSAGLTQKYDGTGVILGIIDSGIDFNHPAFKDASGKTRIVGLYRDIADSDGNLTMTELTGDALAAAIDTMTTDKSTSTHGTNTTSIAGGSEVKVLSFVDVNGKDSVTYGGMAPGTDLYICALGNSQTQTRIMNSMEKICAYADSQGKPVVLSVSLGSLSGLHNGTNKRSSLIEQLFADKKGHVYVNSSGNYANTQLYLTGNVSAENPLQSIITGKSSSDGNTYSMSGYTCMREPDVYIRARLYVVDTSANTVVWDSGEMSNASVKLSDSSTDANGTTLGTYVSDATISFTRSSLTVNDVKNYYISYSLEGVTTSANYAFAVSFYPTSAFGTQAMDGWITDGYSTHSFTSNSNFSDFNFVAGTDEVSCNDISTDPNVIAIGAYTTRNQFKTLRYIESSGSLRSSTYNISTKQPMDDISNYSSYAKKGVGPMDESQCIPYVTTPGTYIVSAFNRYDTADLRIGKSSTSVKGPVTNPSKHETVAYGTNQGTSMACPMAAGVIALWLQVNPELTSQDVRDIMAATAINDDYTSASPDKFGYGKLDALAGIKYILSSEKYNPTGIREIETKAATSKKIYNLNGQQLQKPQKGINIIDGKKVYIK